MDENQALELRDNARYQLQQIKDVETGIEYLNKIKAIEIWVKAEKKDAELQNMVAEQKLRTQRILGQLIKKGQGDGEIATRESDMGNQYTKMVCATGEHSTPKTLSEIGITRKESSIFQAIASIPDSAFEEAINEKKQAVNRAVGELTTAGMLKMKKQSDRQNVIMKQVEQIENDNIIKFTGLYDIVVIDPPWPYGRKYDPDNSRVANPYPEMNLSDIEAIDIPVKDNSVVFLWTTHAFLPAAFPLLSAWGFMYKAMIVWDKENIGMGQWFRMQCEFCLVGIKGAPVWKNTTERDIIREQRRAHSRKPDAFYNMVDKITFGRKLDYFSREQRKGWDLYGNDTGKF